MTHIKLPRESEWQKSMQHEANWQGEAIRLSDLLHEAIEGLRFYAEQADYEQQIIVRDCGCCSYLEDPIILDDKGNLARRVLEKLVRK
jgi:hypothetical protein